MGEDIQVEAAWQRSAGTAVTDDDRHPLDYYPEEETGDERADTLMLLSKAQSALALAATLSDIGAVREIAERARRYASTAKLGRDAENHCVRLRLEAERKAGALLAEMDRQHKGRPEKMSDVPTFSAPKLTDLGVSRQQASDWQRMAKVPAPAFEEYVQQIVSASRPLTTAGVVQIARKIEREQRAAGPRPIVAPSSVPGTIDQADARSLPVEDESVDLIVTSPPYALDIDYADGGDVDADDWSAFMVAWLKEALRVTKWQGRLALNVPLDVSEPYERPTYAQAVHAAIEAGWLYQATIVWHENNTTKGNRSLGSVNSSARPHPVDSSEMIAIFSKGKWGPSSSNPDDITGEEWQAAGRGPWTFSGESRPWEDHPAAFPMELPRRLVRYLSRVGDVVLDPFLGSGTTLVAASELGRCGIGFDRSERYVQSARRRMAVFTRAGGGES